MMDPSKLKVVELRAALGERGLDTKGNKPVLVERLRKALEEEAEEYDPAFHTESISDTALKETQERSSQSPRTPSRASRSSSMTTPTKISTRNASKASTPISSKQSTPVKSQYDEKAYETLISESISEEAIQQEEMSKLSPEKYREEQEEDASNILQNKIYSSDKYEEEEEEAKRVNILEGNKYRANILQVPVTEPSEKPSTIARIDQFSISRGDHEAKGSSIDEDGKIQQLTAEAKAITKLEEKTEIKDEDIGKIQDAFEKSIKDKISIEKENVEHREDKYNIKDNTDIPEVEQPTHVIPDQVDKTCELKHDEKTIHDDYTVQDEKMDISVNVENLNEKNDDIDISRDKQDSKIGENYFLKQKATLDAEGSKQMECNDRKRKRSPSPAEVHQLSPVPRKTEDEPDLDESVVILSWYDSDLNLVIDKDGFLSATPMHDGDLCDMWAGARASHGVLNGKVYFEARITQHCPTTTKDEKHSHMLRIGWSVSSSSMQLGEEKLSYAYTSAGQQGTDKKFTDYGSPFGKDDIVGCYLDMTPENTVELFYTINGKNIGSAFSVSKEELGDRPLFPHILSKNCTFACNFGQEEAWCEQISGYILVGNIESKDKIAGPRRPDEKADCEVIMMCGLPAAGKTTWARKHAADHPDKLYNILALHNLVEKTGDIAVSDQEQNICQREIIDRCNRALDQLIDVAGGRRRNYILDQKNNIYSSVQRRKMRNFCGYQRKAIVVIPMDEEYNQRLSMQNTNEENSSESNLTEMKGNFTIPSVGEFFDVVEWIGLGEEEAKKLVEKYNKEGKDAGFSQQSAAKRPRFDKTEGNKETRDSRNSRDTRDRRNNYQDRGRNPSWRGGNMGGWRGERPQRGGYMRHTGGYGPHPVPWRLRGRGGPAMARGTDRRMSGGVDRRQGNDRNRSVAPRQGGWGPMSGNYQGSQQSSWGQQDNWSSGSQATGNWNQQSGWGQQQWGGGWKGYGQSTYGQAGYNQHGYGNGNWNSWNQQYYNNQYWGQQQQSGQTTAAGGQAVSKQ
ncbi:PREDICTED: heterogeneous nuclear ribonucleoprotein U isoform X2 [Wasmannia auropunctata]|uniref:heterogeneous nuclear ribonucleoprotein U isoform X2 n=1 Tax=Wasmannia auropunctata TaxID=64793 RepID=UPI0005EEA7A3|nr:PREDICTED: heterogeneous nuclear ribonucleoprotein U isoform X2 [Wasmannia auropunctata]XP_011689251.1 PREDICTED: heterogeneous nuclear ribonucleoprotein U isoform X2 [Wasmannia auropunctata]